MTVFSHELNLSVKPIAKHSWLAGNYALPMDIFEIRHRNLLAILEALEARGVTKNKDQAQQIGALGASYLSQLKAGKKLGEDTARKIEAATRRPNGWMDQPQWKDAHQPALSSHSQPVRLDPVMLSQTYKALLTLDPEADHPISLANLDDAAHFVQVYEMRAAMPIQPSQEEWIEFGRKLATLTPTGGDDERGGSAVSATGTHTSKVAGKVRREA